MTARLTTTARLPTLSAPLCWLIAPRPARAADNASDRASNLASNLASSLASNLASNNDESDRGRAARVAPPAVTLRGRPISLPTLHPADSGPLTTSWSRAQTQRTFEELRGKVKPGDTPISTGAGRRASWWCWRTTRSCCRAAGSSPSSA